MTSINRFALFMVIFIHAACSPSKHIIPFNDSSIERIVTNYLRCGECVNGELAQVQILGESALPYLEDIVEYGAPQQIIYLAYLNYKATSEKIDLWHKQNKLDLANIDPLISAKQIDNLMRSRAVEAIAAIGGKKGGRILERLQDIVIDENLLQTITFAIQNPQFFKPSIFQPEAIFLNTN